MRWNTPASKLRVLAGWLVFFLLAASAPANGETSRHFNVPAGKAADTLKRFSAQAELEIMFPSEAVAAVRTNAVFGVFTAREALERLLAHTGLTAIQEETTGALMITRTPEPKPSTPRPRPNSLTVPDNPETSMTSVNKRKKPIAWLSSLLALAVATSAQAQTTPADPSSKGEDVVELSPFVINAEEDSGYQATNTLAGSRMNTSLKDTAASLTVLTSELLSDIGALNLDQAIGFATNIEFDDTNVSNGNATFEFFNTFRIRGQAATVGRNYFRWKLPTNTFNVERIEEARGPNSILFGIASAGGMISSQTKQASTGRSFSAAQVVYGIYDLRRVSVDINQASDNGKLGVRFNAVTQRGQAYQHYVFNNDDRVHLAVKYNLTPSTVIRAEFERGHTLNNRVEAQELGDNLMRWYQAGKPLVTTTSTATGVTRNSATTASLSVNPVEDANGNITNYDARGQGITQAVGSGLITFDPTLIDPVNYRVNLGGPSQTQESWFNTYAAFLDQKFWKGTYLQLAYNHQDYRFSGWQASNPTGLKGDPNQFLRDGVTPNPNAGGLYFETFWTNYRRWEHYDNGRVSLSQELDFGKWGEYRLAALAEREGSRWEKRGGNEAWRSSVNNQGAFAAAPDAGANRVLRRHYITPGDYNTYYASASHPDPDTGAGYITNLVDPSNPARTLYTKMLPVGSSDFDDPQQQDSYLFAGQAYYFKRKLVLAGGYRLDTLYLHEGVRGLRDPVTQEFIIDNVNNPRKNRTLDAKTKTYGVVYHVLPWVSLRYNKSDSIELANAGVRLMPRPDANGHFLGLSRVGDNPQGQGEDYGIQLNLLDNRITVTATRFTTNRVGLQNFIYGGSVDNPTVMSNNILNRLQTDGLITTAENDLHRINSGGSEADVASSGYEFAITANLTKNWRVSANYSITDSVTANVAPEIQAWAAIEIPYFKTFDQSLLVAGNLTIAQEIARWEAANANNKSVEGLATQGNRRDKVNVLTRYSFSQGALKGLYVGGSAVHQGKMALAATTARTVLYGNSFTRVNTFLGYNFGRVPHMPFLKNLSMQLNVDNVLDQHDPLLRRVANANAAVIEYNRIQPQDPRRWQLTANLRF